MPYANFFRHFRSKDALLRALLAGEAVGAVDHRVQLSRRTLAANFVPKPGSAVPFEVTVQHLVRSFI